MKIFLIILFAAIFLIAIFTAIAYSAGLVIDRMDSLTFCIHNFFCYKKTKEYLDTEWRKKTDKCYYSNNLNEKYSVPDITTEKQTEINRCVLSIFYETAIFQRMVSNSNLDSIEIITFMKYLGDFLHNIPSDWSDFLFLYKGTWNKESKLKFLSFMKWIISLKSFCKSIPNSCAGNFNYDTGYCLERIKNNCGKILELAEYTEDCEQPKSKLEIANKNNGDKN
mgnify:FL=1